jgi:hypothetical protein
MLTLAMVATSHLQPCADYFNSSLMIQNFTLSNVTNGNNHVIFYDERASSHLHLKVSRSAANCGGHLQRAGNK